MAQNRRKFADVNLSQGSQIANEAIGRIAHQNLCFDAPSYPSIDWLEHLATTLPDLPES